MSELRFEFANPPQKQFYYATERNQVFSGGFNNGKTFIGCLKAQTLLFTFPGYRYIIARQTFRDLKKTTMQTFFKMLAGDMVLTHNEQDGFTTFRNGSAVYWLHLDKVDENTLRGIEANGILVDQAEETDEKVYDVLDARLGRWDGPQLPPSLQNYAKGDWPLSHFGKPVFPSYHSLLSNPDTFFHYIYRYYHPDSPDRRPRHFYVEGEWDPNLGSRETYDNAVAKDPEWVNKYVRGQWGASAAQIHLIPPGCFLEYDPDLIAYIKEKGNLFRSLDHGDSAPTCCLWFAALDGVFICYREYYVPSRVISYHRKAIVDLSEGEAYSGNYADPAIFKKTAQKDGGFWTVSDEYRSDDVEGPPLIWIPADNNEFATRNRINELLLESLRFKNPVTKKTPAAGLYFIKSHPDYPYGCKESIRQISAQRKVLLGTIDGKSVYSDDRDENIPDHAYDPTRYFVAMHGSSPIKARKSPSRNSFAYFNALQQYNKMRGPQPASTLQ
jgi:hypothetical protein